MAAKLKKKKKLKKQFQKISSKMIDKALDALSQQGVAVRGKGLHNARKRFKQLRGMLRLIRYGLGKKAYKRENSALRNLGKPLSAVRDADVMIETLDGLIAHFQDQVSEGLFKTLRGKLVSRRRMLRRQILEKEKAMAKVAASTKKVRKQIQAWPSFPDRFKILKQGIGNTYEQARQQMNIALNEPTVENYHAWRKSVKYLRYQLEILESLWPPLMGEMAKQSHHLADLLGTDHDLVVLGELAQNELTEFLEDPEAELLTALINQRRAELEHEAMALGQRLYAETDKQFTQRLKGYWQTWQSDGQAPAQFPTTIRVA
jgi:CHAD domain-containing protein